MIKVILKGGLGNQMFQYAAGKSLARHLGTDVVLDTSFLDNIIPIRGFTRRKYRLGDFGINEKLTSKFKNKFLNAYFSYPFYKFSYPLIKNKYVQVDPYKFEESFYDLRDGAIIDGYFNNIEFFKGVESNISEYFNVDMFKSDKIFQIEKEIENTDSVSLHIRQGDYKNQKHIDIYTQLDGEYYNEAIRIIKSSVSNPHFFVFAYGVDDDFVEKNLELETNEYTTVSFDDKSDLRLMSICKHNIIANSSYSFWGAYLNKNPTKVVISPLTWGRIWQNFVVPMGWIGL